MSKLDDATREVATATTEVADAVDALRRTIHERVPVPAREQRGYVSELRPPSAAALALRFCHDHETGESLAAMLKLVPQRFVSEETVQCLCGSTVPRAPLWTECPGECGRVFISDHATVWAVRFPKGADDA